MLSERKLTLAMLALAFCIYAFHSSSLIEYAYDDAFISCRYAENLANGHGLVYNIGERVEGYTNFLWTLLLAGAIRLGTDPIVFAKALGILFAIATMLLTFRLSAWLTGRNSWQNALPVLFLACSGPFVAWAQWGLEGGMFTFFALLGVFLFLRGISEQKTLALASLSFACAALTRPEGVIFFIICFSYYLLLVWRAATSKRARSARESVANEDLATSVLIRRLPLRFAQLIMPFVLIYGAYYVWRYAYYGYPFPNTYYVRMAGSFSAYMDQWVRGARYIFDFIVQGSGAAVVILIALLWLAYRPSRRSPMAFLSLFCVIPILYSLHVGGDSKHFFRLLMPYLPILYILVGQSLYGISRLVLRNDLAGRVRPLAGVVFAAFIALLLGYTYYFPTFIYFSGGNRPTLSWAFIRGKTPAHEAVLGYERQKMLVGEWLRKHAPEGTTIATTVAGVTPYYSKLYTYDMLGVTNEHIAHTEPQPNRNVSVDIEATFPDKPKGIVKNILITSHLKSDNEYIIRLNPTLIIEGYDIAFRRAGYKMYRMPIKEFTQHYFAKQPVEFLP